MKTRVKLLVAAVAFFGLFQQSAFAGPAEIELAASYRKSTINEDNFQTNLSYTGSFSYYFWSQSALEFSYTTGLAELSVKASTTEPTTVYKTKSTVMGVDLVFAFADRQAPFQPYIKAGAAHIKKEVYREAADGSLGTDKLEGVDGVAPSAGAGFKIGVTQGFSIKIGLDGWLTPQADKSNGEKTDPTFDYAARAGIVWQF